MLMMKKAYERYANARDEATLAAKLNVRGEAAYKHLSSTCGEATLRRVSNKALSAKLASRRS